MGTTALQAYLYTIDVYLVYSYVGSKYIITGVRFTFQNSPLTKLNNINGICHGNPALCFYLCMYMYIYTFLFKNITNIPTVSNYAK